MFLAVFELPNAFLLDPLLLPLSGGDDMLSRYKSGFLNFVLDGDVFTVLLSFGLDTVTFIDFGVDDFGL